MGFIFWIFLNFISDSLLLASILRNEKIHFIYIFGLIKVRNKILVLFNLTFEDYKNIIWIWMYSSWNGLIYDIVNFEQHRIEFKKHISNISDLRRRHLYISAYKINRIIWDLKFCNVSVLVDGSVQNWNFSWVFYTRPTTNIQTFNFRCFCFSYCSNPT